MHMYTCFVQQISIHTKYQSISNQIKTNEIKSIKANNSNQTKQSNQTLQGTSTHPSSPKIGSALMASQFSLSLVRETGGCASLSSLCREEIIHHITSKCLSCSLIICI